MSERGERSCKEWQEVLASLGSEAVNESLQAHLACCQDCTEVHHQRQNMRVLIDEYWGVAPELPFPARLLQL